MSEEMLTLLEQWEGRGVVVSRDGPTGTWIFIALHDDTLGRPVGGCRMKVYESPSDGLRDALRLAEGMTCKWAAIGFPFGGGKSVLAIPRPLEGEERDGLLERFGRLLNSLRGAYSTGEDLGTTPEDMQRIARESEWVMGVDPDSDELVDPGPYTALGVRSGMEAALAHLTGEGSLEGRRVLVQGVGDVGEPLARMVSEAGGKLLISDLDGERAARVALEVGGEPVDPEEVYGIPCDIYAPSAVGATLNSRTIPLLSCRAVVGSANNQLERPEDADRLRVRGILYAPDFVVNAGGAMAFGLMHQGIEDTEEIRRRVRGIGDTLEKLFVRADREEISPVAAALRTVEGVLAERSSGRVASLTTL